MKSKCGAIALGLALLGGGVPAVMAGEMVPNGALVSTKRQISECMSKHMAGNRNLSYNEAGKLCKDQVKAQAVTAPLSPSSKTIGAH